MNEQEIKIEYLDLLKEVIKIQKRIFIFNIFNGLVSALIIVLIVINILGVYK